MDEEDGEDGEEGGGQGERESIEASLVSVAPSFSSSPSSPASSSSSSISSFSSPGGKPFTFGTGGAGGAGRGKTSADAQSFADKFKAALAPAETPGGDSPLNPFASSPLTRSPRAAIWVLFEVVRSLITTATNSIAALDESGALESGDILEWTWLWRDGRGGKGSGGDGDGGGGCGGSGRNHDPSVHTVTAARGASEKKGRKQKKKMKKKKKVGGNDGAGAGSPLDYGDDEYNNVMRHDYADAGNPVRVAARAWLIVAKVRARTTAPRLTTSVVCVDVLLMMM